MDNKYEGKFERDLIEDDFKFCRLVDGYNFYRKWNGDIMIAKVNEKGKLEVLLYTNLKEEIKDE